MNVESVSDHSEPWAPLTDLSDVPLDTPLPSDDPVIALALRRVLGSLHDKSGVLSSFGSFISQE